MKRTVVDFDPFITRVEGVVFDFDPSVELVDVYSNGETVENDF